MKITILNANPESGNPSFDGYLGSLASLLNGQGHTVETLTLREMDLRYCIGCFGCWVKTPGECFSADDSSRIRQSVIASDITVFVSPLRMGFPSALLKLVMDKMIPLIHPYFTVVNGEAHHRARYAHYPRLGLLLERENDTDAGDLNIVSDIFSRTALNLKTRLDFALLTERPVEEVARAITSPKSQGVPFEAQPTPIPGVRVNPPGRLVVFNGSPRGRKGGTPLMLEQFLNGFTSLPGRSFEMFHLNRLKEAQTFPQAYAGAEYVLLGFPLYTDAMPGIVKAFIEQLEPLRGRPGNPPVGFLVQSGFPEAVHSRHVERYLEKLAIRLGSPYLGTIVKGGGEAVHSMPENMNRKLFEQLSQLGLSFGERGQFDPQLLREIARPERYPAILTPVFKLLSKTSLLSFYWDGQLKQNGAYEKRFDHPYAE